MTWISSLGTVLSPVGSESGFRAWVGLPATSPFLLPKGSSMSSIAPSFHTHSTPTGSKTSFARAMCAVMLLSVPSGREPASSRVQPLAAPP